LNFRCEIYSKPEDKCKGGRDFQAVKSKVLSNHGKLCDNDELKNLFCNYDRIRLYLEQQQDVNIPPSILHDTVELFDEQCFSPDTRNPVFHYPIPTFTYDIDGNYPRNLGKKRTPGWPDRILVDKNIRKTVLSIEVHDDVLISDHIPVHCLLQMKK